MKPAPTMTSGRATDLGAALHVDGAELLAEREVVERLEALGLEIPWRSNGLEHDVVVLTADGHTVDDDVADPAEQALELGPGLVGVALERLDLLAQRAGVRPRLVRHLLQVVGV